jgi:hypothetical protein
MKKAAVEPCLFQYKEYMLTSNNYFGFWSYFRQNKIKYIFVFSLSTYVQNVTECYGRQTQVYVV